MKDNTVLEVLTSLAKKAGMTNDGAEAMRFSQAALNLAHARATLKATEREEMKITPSRVS